MLLLLKNCSVLGISPEVNPKWEVLSEILEEINILTKDLCKMDDTFNNKVLILVQDSKTCNQLKQVNLQLLSYLFIVF